VYCIWVCSYEADFVNCFQDINSFIPSSEKIYSIFEPNTKWISKNKQNKKVALGHKILISTCQHHFILHHQVIKAMADVELTRLRKF
jgi:transposase, IS5 family